MKTTDVLQLDKKSDDNLIYADDAGLFVGSEGRTKDCSTEQLRRRLRKVACLSTARKSPQFHVKRKDRPLSSHHSEWK